MGGYRAFWLTQPPSRRTSPCKHHHLLVGGSEVPGLSVGLKYLKSFTLFQKALFVAELALEVCIIVY